MSITVVCRASYILVLLHLAVIQTSGACDDKHYWNIDLSGFTDVIFSCFVPKSAGVLFHCEHFKIKTFLDNQVNISLFDTRFEFAIVVNFQQSRNKKAAFHGFIFKH